MNDLAKYLFLLSIFVLVCLTGQIAFADQSVTNATCDIDCIVAGQLEWDGNFDDIDISEELTEQADVITSDGTSNVTLWMNGNVVLTTTGATGAQLTEDAAANDLLETEYQITYDGDGSTATGGSTAAWDDFADFMKTAVGTPSAVTHYSEDGAVVVTLHVRAFFDTDNVANAGNYSAIQTIIATWTP